MIDEKFIDEIKKYSLKDLELIYSTQKDLYSEDEMAVIYEEINKRKNEIRERIKSKLPKDIVCPKCNGLNSFENQNCKFCGRRLDKREYYDSYEDYCIDCGDDNQDIHKDDDSSSNSDSYTFQYVISFLVPLVGFILGAILLSKDSNDEKSKGKTCIIIGIVAMLIYIIMVSVL